jgi:hypothetical protein
VPKGSRKAKTGESIRLGSKDTSGRDFGSTKASGTLKLLGDPKYVASKEALQEVQGVLYKWQMCVNGVVPASTETFNVPKLLNSIDLSDKRWVSSAQLFLKSSYKVREGWLPWLEVRQINDPTRENVRYSVCSLREFKKDEVIAWWYGTVPDTTSSSGEFDAEDDITGFAFTHMGMPCMLDVTAMCYVPLLSLVNVAVNEDRTVTALKTIQVGTELYYKPRRFER